MDGLRHFPAGKASAFISQRALRVALNVFRFIADDRYGADQDAWVTKEDVRSHLCSDASWHCCKPPGNPGPRKSVVSRKSTGGSNRDLGRAESWCRSNRIQAQDRATGSGDFFPGRFDGAADSLGLPPHRHTRTVDH